jgi:glyoxylase-like metal-dependent hydrolase (beta-lactamase superfamily II)
MFFMKQISLPPETIVDLPHPDDGTHVIAPDLAYRRLALVNVVFLGRSGAGDRQWTLIDAGVGVPGLGGLIESAARERFGQGARPAAIVMTHGHFDHVGVLEKLAEKWDAPIYAHELEVPYLNGTASYPPPDSMVGGGIMPWVAQLFPRGPIDVSRCLRVLPDDGSVPGMPGWRWLHTPGHATGHVSLWRESDRAIIAGDAFITTRMESAYAVTVQRPEMHGPPMYFTMDFEAAKRSVQMLAKLEPELVVTGHGRAMRGPEMRTALHLLAEHFDHYAVPKNGRYVKEPAIVSDGTAYRQP